MRHCFSSTTLEMTGIGTGIQCDRLYKEPLARSIWPGKPALRLQFGRPQDQRPILVLAPAHECLSFFHQEGNRVTAACGKCYACSHYCVVPTAGITVT